MNHDKWDNSHDWVGELDVLFGKLNLSSPRDYNRLRRFLDEAPEGARQTADYWYARGWGDAKQWGTASTSTHPIDFQRTRT